MLVSIVIPVYNRAEMVKATLESVRKQTHRPIHLVLVDNNSSDSTLHVLQTFKQDSETSDFKIDVIQEQKHGACAARNAGARLVQSEWLMFFDSDDTMSDCLVSKYVEKIKSIQEGADIVSTNIEMIKNGKSFGVNFAKKDFMENHIFHATLSTQRYIMRKTIFEQSGGWNEKIECWNDWEMGIRILLLNPKIAVVDDGIYVHVNAHDDSITGACYSQNYERKENAIVAAINAVDVSNYLQKERVKKLLQIRRFVLAGLFKREGKEELASSYYNFAISNIEKDKKLCVLATFVYRYVSWGGRGIDRLIRFLI